MNYIREIKSFYDWLEINSVSDSAINLWHALMHINNKASSSAEWKEEFTVAISTLQAKTSLSKSSIIRARNQLQQLGRISFRERRGNQSAVYSVNAFRTDTQSETQTDTQSETQTDTQNNLRVTQTHKADANRNTKRTQIVTQSDTINKLNKTKLINTLTSVEESTPDFEEEKKIPDSKNDFSPIGEKSEAKEKEKKVPAKKEKEIKIIFGSCQNVELSEKELASLKERASDCWADVIEKLSTYKLKSGKAYKSDYGAILNWVISAVREDRERLEKSKKQGKTQSERFADLSNSVKNFLNTN